MYKAKAESLKEYLQELDTRIEGGVITKESQVLKKDIKEENNFNLKIGDDGIYDVSSGISDNIFNASCCSNALPSCIN